MTKKLSTYNEQVDLSEEQRKSVELILSELPAGMKEEHASILFGLCFHPAGFVGTCHNTTADNVRQIKSRNREAFEGLYAKRNQLLARKVESGMYGAIESVSHALNHLDPDSMKKPQNIAVVVNSLIGLKSLVDKLDPQGEQASTKDVAKALEGLELLKGLPVVDAK